MRFILLGGLLMVGFLFCVTPLYADDEFVKPFVDEQCAESFACRDTIIYELVYDGNVVSLGDLSEEECESLKADVEAQTEAFSILECRARLVEREKI